MKILLTALFLAALLAPVHAQDVNDEWRSRQDRLDQDFRNRQLRDQLEQQRREMDRLRAEQEAQRRQLERQRQPYPSLGESLGRGLGTVGR